MVQWLKRKGKNLDFKNIYKYRGVRVVWLFVILVIEGGDEGFLVLCQLLRLKQLYWYVLGFSK